MKLTALALSLALVGCASPAAYMQHQQAQTALDQLSRAEYWVDVDLVNPGQLSQAQQSAAVQALEPALKPCLDSVETGLLSLRLARSKAEQLQMSQGVDNSFDACARKSGLTGRVNFKVGDKFLTFPEFIEAGARAADAAAAAQTNVQAAESDNALAWAYGLTIRPLAPQTVYVDPHMRSNGSFVRGHVRTSPDGYCMNNIGGCR